MEMFTFTFKLRVTVISLFLIIATEDFVRGAFPLEPKDIVFVGLSQPNAYHKGRAEVFRQHLEEQFKDLKHPEQPVIHLLHEIWPTTGSWTILPILPSILTVPKTQKWLFVSDVETRLNVTKLLHSLSSYNHDESLFIGRGLHDKDATIIHHFRRPDNPFAFPDFAAGFLMSSELIKIVSERLISVKPKSDFSIDVKYELALYIYNKGEGVPLTEVSFLCAAEHQQECATTYPLKFPECGEPVSEDEVFVAVKTCKKFHNTRVPVVQKTWGKQTKHIEYYSEEADESIPTIDLGVPNTEGGHCAKTYAILVRAVKQAHIANKKWLVITDDDTLLSVPRLRRLLACYDPTEPVALGERYGYGVNANYGYDYVTGGGGMVFSLPTVHQLLSCPCGAPNSPDDMHLGMCLKRFNIPVTHSPLFHQARPADYAPGYLSSQLPVSFHKHWNCDPLKEYTQWLAADDDHSVNTAKEPHLEL